MDLDKMFKLAEEDPEGFKEYSEALLQEHFESLPEDRRNRAEQIQWKLDGTLRKYKNNIARMNKAGELMLASLNELNMALNGGRDDGN